MGQHLVQFRDNRLPPAGGHGGALDEAQGFVIKALGGGGAQLLQGADGPLAAAHMHHGVAHPDDGDAEAVEGVAQGIDDEGSVVQQHADPAVAGLGVVYPHQRLGIEALADDVPDIQQQGQQVVSRGLQQFRLRGADEILPRQHLHGVRLRRLKTPVYQTVEGSQGLEGGGLMVVH